MLAERGSLRLMVSQGSELFTLTKFLPRPWLVGGGGEKYCALCNNQMWMF
jgi:hypothetical protein